MKQIDFHNKVQIFIYALKALDNLGAIISVPREKEILAFKFW